MRWGVVVAAAVALGGLAPAADAATFLGRPWPGRRITYAVTSPTLKAQVRIAARAWNRSGARVRFVETSRSKARLLISAFRRRPCFGIVGQATAGYPGNGRRSRMMLQPSCPYGVRVMTAAHEFGHVLGLGHQERGCALMSAVYLSHCRPQPLEWEWFCQPARSDDVKGALRLYGGHFHRPSSTFCIAPTVPGPVRAMSSAADPAGSLARVRLTFVTPATATLRRVIVSRGHGCPDTPVSFAVPIQQRVGVKPRFGTLVEEKVNPGRSVPMSVDDLDVGAGSWCYAVFTLDRQARWRLAGTRRVTLGATPPLAGRIGLAATVVSGGTGVQLTWTNPAAPLAFVNVMRASGACPSSPGQFFTVATPPAAPGPATATDAPVQPGTWCYGVQFTTSPPVSRPLVATVQVTVP